MFQRLAVGRSGERWQAACSFEEHELGRGPVCSRASDGGGRECVWQELGDAMRLDSNNLFFVAQAACLMAEAKCRLLNHAGALLDAQHALHLRQAALHRTGRAPPLAHRPYVVLAQCSRQVGAFDAALSNLTRAAALAPPHAAQEIADMLDMLRRDKDTAEHEHMQRQGFAGFRAAFERMQRPAQQAAAAAAANAAHGGVGGGSGHDGGHPAFAAARGQGESRWAYSDWSKAKWDEEYRAAYERLTKDKQRFGFAGTHKFPWEWDHHQAPTSHPPPDPFASRPAAAAAGGGSGKQAGAAGGGRGVGRGLYAVLQVEVSASVTEIKKAYMKLVAPRMLSLPCLPAHISFYSCPPILSSADARR